MNPLTIVVDLIALAVAVAAGYFLHRYQAEKALKNQQDKADSILKGASEQARLIESQARENAVKIVHVVSSSSKWCSSVCISFQMRVTVGVITEYEKPRRARNSESFFRKSTHSRSFNLRTLFWAAS